MGELFRMFCIVLLYISFKFNSLNMEIVSEKNFFLKSSTTTIKKQDFLCG